MVIESESEYATVREGGELDPPHPSLTLFSPLC